MRPDLFVVDRDAPDRQVAAFLPEGLRVRDRAVEDHPADAGPDRVSGHALEPLADHGLDDDRRRALAFRGVDAARRAGGSAGSRCCRRRAPRSRGRPGPRTPAPPSPASAGTPGARSAAPPPPSPPCRLRSTRSSGLRCLDRGAAPTRDRRSLRQSSCTHAHAWTLASAAPTTVAWPRPSCNRSAWDTRCASSRIWSPAFPRRA